MSGERCAAGEPSLAEGQSVAVLGSNGAGKTTLMRALAGLQPPAARGEIRFEGRSISRDAAHRRVRAGLVLVPEGRQVFPELSVRDNLRLGAFANSGANLDARIEEGCSTAFHDCGSGSASAPAFSPAASRALVAYRARPCSSTSRKGLSYGPGGERLAHSASPQPNGSRPRVFSIRTP